jgi:segregation and condensation protein A
VLEERDLLFARVLQYRAYKQAAGLFGARMAEQVAYVPRRVGAEDLLRRIVPELLVGVAPEELARLAAAAFVPAPRPQVTTTHIAPPRLSVAEAVATLARRLQDRGSSSFEDLVGRQAEPIEVVIGLLAVLELYKRSLVELDQTSTFGDIAVRWTGGDLVDPIDTTVEEPA